MLTCDAVQEPIETRFIRSFAEPVTSPTLLRLLTESAVEETGWHRFVRTYEPLVLNWCRRKGLQHADAHDVAQDVFSRLSRQFHRFRHDPSRSFRGWLKVLTHAAWCDWLERQRSWQKGTNQSAVLRGIAAPRHAESPYSPLKSLADAELIDRAFQIVRNRVEPRTWEAFRLLALEGLSGDEAAERLGMKRGSAHAARCKVQRLVRLELARLLDTSLT